MNLLRMVGFRIVTVERTASGRHTVKAEPGKNKGRLQNNCNNAANIG
jgi:hypothetical protein